MRPRGERETEEMMGEGCLAHLGKVEISGSKKFVCKTKQKKHKRGFSLVIYTRQKMEKPFFVELGLTAGF